MVTAAVVSASAAVAIAIPRATYPAPDADDDSFATVSVTERTDDLAAPATLALEWEPSRPLAVGAGAVGTVTDVYIETGDQLACGDPVIRVDGRDLIAYCAPAPLYRTIAAGIVGDDVDQFVDFLRTTGRVADSTPDSTQLTAAIDELRRDLGLDAGGDLQPADTVWIGEQARVGAVTVRIGDALLGGEHIAEVDPVLLGARLTSPPPAGSTWVFAIEGASGRAPVDADGDLLVLDAAAGDLLSPGSDMSALPSTIDGTIRLEVPISVIGVPASAIVTDEARTCVYAIDDVPTVVAVDVVGSSVGTAFVTGAIRPGQLVKHARPARRRADGHEPRRASARGTRVVLWCRCRVPSW